MTEPVLCEIGDRVAVLTLNRPEKLNALNYALIDCLLASLDHLETDNGVRAAILTGAGERAFSAGADIHEFSASVAEGADAALCDFVMRGQRLTARLEAYRKPVIAAVNGLALGGGCEITEAVSLAIASDRALFAEPEIRLAMPPIFGGTQRLPRLAGRKRALELLLTGEPFSPARALELDLVNKVVPLAELMPAAFDLASRIVRHSRAAVASTLTAVARGIKHRRRLAGRGRTVRPRGSDRRPQRRAWRLDRAAGSGLSHGRTSPGQARRGARHLAGPQVRAKPLCDPSCWGGSGRNSRPLPPLSA